MLGFASTRADNRSQQSRRPQLAQPNGSTDIYYMNATDWPGPARQQRHHRDHAGSSVQPTGNLYGRAQTADLQPADRVDALDKPGLTDFDPSHAEQRGLSDLPAVHQLLPHRLPERSGHEHESLGLHILDLDAPTLLKYDETNNEIVHVERADAPGVPLLQRFVDPGTRVRFKVRAVDYESGIKYVYLQIKCPDSAPQSYDNQEHKIF